VEDLSIVPEYVTPEFDPSQQVEQASVEIPSKLGHLLGEEAKSWWQDFYGNKIWEFLKVNVDFEQNKLCLLSKE